MNPVRDKKSKFIFLVSFFISMLAPVGLAQASTIFAAPDATGLVGYWSLDASTINWATGIVRDLSGQKNNGNVINMSTTTSPTQGVVNQALKFDGASSYVSEGTSISQIKSVAFWVKATTGASQGLINLTGSTVYISTNASKVISGTGFTSPAYYVDGKVSSTPSLSDSNWHHVVVIGTAAVTGSQLEIGRANSTYFAGTLDEVRVYSRALTSAQVATLYNDSKATHVDAANTTSLSSRLVAYWPLDGSTINWATGIVRDLTGNNLNGSLVLMSTTTSPVTGKIGGALKFNGVTAQYVNVADNSRLDGSVGTVSLWVKIPHASTGNGYYLVGKAGTGGSFNGYSIFSNGGDIGVAIKNASTQLSLEPAGSYANGLWHHVVLVYQSGGTSWLYVDGVMQMSGVAPAFSIVTSQPLRIGKSVDVFWQALAGSIDDVRIYGRVMSAAEVHQLYLLGAANVAHSNTTSVSSGLVGYWPLDGNTTSWKTDTTQDMSGNNNTGSLIAMSTSSSPVAGKIGSALKFDGVSSYIDIGSPVSLAVSQFTICAWIKPSALSGFQLIYGKNSAAKLYTNGSALSLQGGTNSSTGSLLTVKIWQHACASNDAINTKYYLNGILQQTSADATAWDLGTQKVKIGQDPSGSTQNFLGSIDEVRIYNRALSAAEVKQLYLTGK